MGVTRRTDRAARRGRLPDEVRSAAVRAWISFSFTLVSVMVTLLASLADGWLFVPAVLVTALGFFASTWCLLEIWIARQIAAQRVWSSDAHPAWTPQGGPGRPPRGHRPRPA
ncbi:hypothetical protein ACIQGZ_21640 [Streptomyces sp. NPDC092296]|uniref:hypothetical protein n=1 Tax=Streptomyces sp. NPDC092296 TaxID=3366012 RepID=UPI00380AC75F